MESVVAPRAKTGPAPPCGSVSSGSDRSDEGASIRLAKRAKKGLGSSKLPRPTASASSASRPTTPTSGHSGAAREAMDTGAPCPAADPAPQQKSKIPPIMLDCPDNWTGLCRTLSGLVRGRLVAKCTGLSMRLQLTSEEDFRVVQSHLQSKGVAYHTYQLSRDKELKVVCRGLPFSVDVGDIYAELTEMGLDVSSVRKLTTRDGRETATCLVALRRTPDVRKVYDIDSLFCCRVKMSAYVAKGGPPLNAIVASGLGTRAITARGPSTV